MKDKLFYAPITSPTAILDVGTGTGIWAMDVADAYPAAKVIGVDLSPTQPTFVPPNLQFEICDAEEDWTFKTEFDLIHTRMMIGSSLKDWPAYFKRAFQALKPGGWVEAQEFSFVALSDDDSIPADSRIKHWEEKSLEGLNMVGMSGICEPDKVQTWLKEAGFTNITVLSFKWPFGAWPKDPKMKECGLFTRVMMEEGWHGLSVKVFTGLLGWSAEELEILLAQCREEIKRKDIHRYWPFWVIYAQKPE